MKDILSDFQDTCTYDHVCHVCMCPTCTCNQKTHLRMTHRPAENPPNQRRAFDDIPHHSLRDEASKGLYAHRKTTEPEECGGRSGRHMRSGALRSAGDSKVLGLQCFMIFKTIIMEPSVNR